MVFGGQHIYPSIFVSVTDRSTIEVIPPPEETGARSRRRPVSFLHVGHTPLRVADSGVGNALLRFRCGAKDALVEFWLADWDTPLFTLTAYDTRRTVLSLTRDDCDRTVVSEALAKAVVSVDSSPRVRLWAQQRGVPVFEGEDALFWAVRHLL